MEKNIGSIKKEGLLFRRRLNKGISTILRKNLAVKKEETVLIVYDSKNADLARSFEDCAYSLCKESILLKAPALKVNGAEPNEECAKKMLECGVIIILTSKSMSHTKARRDATKKGARIASMPGITTQIIARSIDIDYSILKRKIDAVGSLLNKGKRVRVTTRLGTDISFVISGRKAHGFSAGIFNKKGKWGNLPEGEVFIAPKEGSAQGHFVVDASIAGIGKIDHPVIFIVNKGRVDKITNGKTPHKIESILNKYGEAAKNIAEFGIGFNKRAKVTGIVLEDEKADGTCHIALGNNIGFGGKVDVPIHIDCVIQKPDIYIDDVKIVKRGKLRI